MKTPIDALARRVTRMSNQKPRIVIEVNDKSLDLLKEIIRYAKPAITKTTNKYIIVSDFDNEHWFGCNIARLKSFGIKFEIKYS